MAVVQILAGYGWTGLLATDDSPYRREVNNWFAPFKDHPAVKRFAELAQAGYNFDAPPATMVCLSPPPDLELQAAPEACGAGRAGGPASLAAWLQQLRAFARASDFNAFFRAQAGLNSPLEESTRKKIDKDYAAQLEAYFGAKQASYHIVLAPLLVGNFGVRRPRPDGAFDIFGVLGSPAQATTLSLRYLVWHEFGHSFVNHEFDQLRDLVDRSSNLLAPIEKQMRAQAYPSWPIVVNEHMVRAMNVRLAFRELGDFVGQAMLANERRNGFAYVEALSEKLKEYEAQRDRYPAFHDFAPQLLTVLDALVPLQKPPQ